MLLAACSAKPETSQFVELMLDPAKDDIRMVWKDSDGDRYDSFDAVTQDISDQGHTVRFAMNGGMFTPDYVPLGLYMENGQRLHKLNTHSGQGNFAIPPNGIFVLTRDHRADIIKTQDYSPDPNIQYATQSGPMLVIDGKINDAFHRRSANLNVRNGVCVRADGKVILSMSKQPISFYDFAAHFQHEGCENALYLDGAISQARLPEAGWSQQTGDNLGTMIIVTTPTPAKTPHG
ncbi:MAG: phosphodiester glycosidase family protein [Alphaproteobacteria bacterium]|nr:phosphodiester glycosidase family protein [Alphaproteobacteria bacterium]MDE2340969.1 phosphodiester glycosidase family protein [Alphaproteobacteria bacterium]